ncbi:MAG: hypothetical protein COT32_02280 [Candidatus Nealsonbacteria bacterium CG08_land_8_20_14_0_20_36_22]|uniref:Uncharacterized protein n=1 Tax=Candidatus Nealsonbacteria bacterium CG08_land_8_20_14_0_20_36_22 TaxID=1974704 RepID=A0A2H0YN93_9BACT|nr:MAG: hypothetical protein COT32_02280 [Candidatus Nealsonbacteria bacterium CG08_land_8_20_14_0_20_36_22]
MEARREFQGALERIPFFSFHWYGSILFQICQVFGGEFNRHSNEISNIYEKFSFTKCGFPSRYFPVLYSPF